MCSVKTWDAVERYAELDAKIDFGVNDKGYCFARINIENGIEQVLSYNPDTSVEVVTGWACGAIPETKVVTVKETKATDAETSTELPF